MPEEKPLNREPALQELISSFITPVTEGYDRNHSVLPALDGDTHRVRINGAVKRSLELSVSDLQNDFVQHDVVCALQCAGNRRNTMRVKIKEVQGINWFDAAVMNCKWTGPRLRDVLDRAGISLDAHEKETSHVAFACNAATCEDDTWCGASIPLARALREDADVLLALKMNDQSLTKAHGYPVRVVTPGIAGARAVKWLDHITVQTRESENFYQQHDYKVLPPEATDAESASKFWDVVPPVQGMPVNSTIATPVEGTTIELDTAGCVTVAGYALPSGDDGPVVKVEVSADAGHHWIEAELLHGEGEGKWSWKLWKCQLPTSAGTSKTLYSRATDAAGNTQPERSQWNLRGVCYNGYGEVTDLTACGLRLGVKVSSKTSHEAIHERQVRKFGVFAEDGYSGNREVTRRYLGDHYHHYCQDERLYPFPQLHGCSVALTLSVLFNHASTEPAPRRPLLSVSSAPVPFARLVELSGPALPSFGVLGAPPPGSLDNRNFLVLWRVPSVTATPLDAAAVATSPPVGPTRVFMGRNNLKKSSCPIDVRDDPGREPVDLAEAEARPGEIGMCDGAGSVLATGCGGLLLKWSSRASRMLRTSDSSSWMRRRCASNSLAMLCCAQAIGSRTTRVGDVGGASQPSRAGEVTGV
ncbi:hypothetical protein LTR91_018496 [Friedmanniomyces endolithicus]|uniref:Sulfite oxidase n=1 Tax=Friedmanniomyces endolithicus TaxID=329885 RepID=A0AAN6K598_9PEZI|nr:hypothetical protein LTR57_021837 [Friedmanniomyces endolithicus]KAK0959302.1 hypothetical protein LTS01_021457 [Friedmanniomyces endolithicus]KAK0964420.1 hypothetical protein LTR91_018496 [Friedmanniomyces endolithicus]KAK1037630.1 hypothetical protein LTS16_012688 [Friedmanniomyces endolithicus]